MTSPNKKSRADRKARDRVARARNAALRILELRKEVEAVIQQDAWSLATTNTIFPLIKEMSEKERLLIGWQYDVDDTVRAAEEYRRQLSNEAQEPKPAKQDGSSVFKKGNSLRRWT